MEAICSQGVPIEVCRCFQENSILRPHADLILSYLMVDVVLRCSKSLKLVSVINRDSTSEASICLVVTD